MTHQLSETPDGTIAADIPCASCEYNLRGLGREGLCPECGHSVAASIVEFHRGMPKAVLRRVRHSIRLVFVATALAWIGGNVSIWRLNAVPNLSHAMVGSAFSIMAWMLACLSIWMLLTLKASDSFRLPSKLKLFLLACTVIPIATLLIVLIHGIPRMPSLVFTPAPDWLTYLIEWTSFAAFLATGGYFAILSKVAGMLRDPFARRAAQIICFATPLLSAPMHWVVHSELASLPPLLYAAIAPIPMIGYGSTAIVIYRNLHRQPYTSVTHELQWLPVPFLAIGTIWVLYLINKRVGRELKRFATD